jgi:ribose transport system permease protein
VSEIAARGPRVRLGLDRFSGLYLWAIFIATFGLWQPHTFLTSTTLHVIAEQNVVVAMLAIAVLMPLAAGAYDLSIGASANLATVMVIVLQTDDHWSMWPAIAVSVTASFVVGIINGLLVVRLHLNSLIATLGMATVAGAVQTILAGGTPPYSPASTSWTALAQRQVLGFQVIFLYLVILALLIWWLLEWTPAGRYLRAVGGNADAARLAGVRTDLWTFVSLALSGAVCGVAGVLYASQSGPSLTYGTALLLPAFAAVFLGSTQFTSGRVNLWGTVLAVYVLATGVQGMELITGVQWLNQMFNGVALLAAVSFAVWRRERDRPSAGTEVLTRLGVDEVGNAELSTQDAPDSNDQKVQEPIS